MRRNLLLLIVSFFFAGTIYAQDHYTPVDPDQGTLSLQVWAEVQIDGVSQTSADLEVGMFLNDTCKDSRRIQAYYNGNFYRVKPYCAYDGAGKIITFKLYDHRGEGEELYCDYAATTTGLDMTLGPTAQNCIVLNFVHEVTPTYDITVTANPTEGGTVNGGGTFEEGTSVTVTATPAEGYTFINWTEDGTEVSTEASYTFEVTAARALVANFEGSSTEPEYPWVVVDPSSGASNAICTAIVQINGVLITDGTDWEVGAFAGDICRGIGNLENGWVEIPEESQSDVPYTYYMMMTLHGNNGEVLSFKLANRTTGEVHPGVCDVTINYQNDGEFGDPWDPVVLNFVAPQEFTKDIVGYSGTGGYYLIASPIGQVNPTAVTHMLDINYDLFYFDQAGYDEQEGGEPVLNEWRNYKVNTFNLEPGKGYLYANSQNVTLTFTGVPYNDGVVTLRKVDTVRFSGWNLIGNPFAQPAYIGDRAYFRMKDDGTEIVAATGGTAIAAMEGIFVIANSDGEEITFSTTTPPQNAMLTINLTQSRDIVDRAILRFDEGGTLPKFQLNENSTKVYIPMDFVDYAVVHAESEGELPLNFKASSNGSYNLSFSSEEVEFSNLHLIDNMTGDDVDLLQTPSYTFNAETTDNANRFTLVFDLSTTGIDENFAYYNNDNWIINNEGKALLQVIDLNGRIISSENINGSASIHENVVAGIYMIRLIKGDEVRVQKIVVR